MSMSTEIKQQVFETLPNRVKAGLRSIDREPSPETELFLNEAIPALGGKSITQVLKEADGETKVVLYCNTVKGKFF
jgi:hypothetical protein